MTKLLLLPALLLSLLAFGCGGDGGGGGGGGGSDEDQIRRTIRDFTAGFNENNADKVYAQLSSASKKDCKKEDIAMVLQLLKAFSGNEKFNVDVQKVTVNGDKATVLIAASIGSERQTPEENPLVKEDGRWKLDFQEGCGLDG